MVDLNSSPNSEFLREEDLRQGIELLFYAYRDFTGEPETDTPPPFADAKDAFVFP